MQTVKSLLEEWRDLKFREADNQVKASTKLLNSKIIENIESKIVRFLDLSSLTYKSNSVFCPLKVK